MARKPSKKVKKHIPIKKLEEKINLEKDKRIKTRLKFLRCLYKGLSVPQASENIGIKKPTGYTWLKKWNKLGYEGLSMKYSTGRPFKLTKAQQEEIIKLINEKIENNEEYTIHQLKKRIKNKYEVKYSQKRIREIIDEWGYVCWHDSQIHKKYITEDEANLYFLDYHLSE